MEVPKCINNNIAVEVCINDQCNHPNPFLCVFSLDCQCIITHWNRLKTILNKSINSTNPNFVKLSSSIEQVINQSIKYLQKQLQYFKLWKSTFGMPSQVIYFFKSIQQNQQYRFTGKSMAKILQDVKKQKIIEKFNEEKTNQQKKAVLANMEQTQKMIRLMYSVQDGDQKIVKDKKSEKNDKIEIKKEMNIQESPKQLSLKIKEYYLDNLNKRLIELNEKPTDLELKFYKYRNFTQFVELIRSPKMNSLKTLTMYCPWILGNDSNLIECEKLISSSLISLPEFQSLKIIAYNIKSKKGFNGLGNRFNAIKDEIWSDRQNW